MCRRNGGVSHARRCRSCVVRYKGKGDVQGVDERSYEYIGVSRRRPRAGLLVSRRPPAACEDTEFSDAVDGARPVDFRAARDLVRGRPKRASTSFLVENRHRARRPRNLAVYQQGEGAKRCARIGAELVRLSLEYELCAKLCAALVGAEARRAGARGVLGKIDQLSQPPPSRKKQARQTLRKKKIARDEQETLLTR